MDNQTECSKAHLQKPLPQKHFVYSDSGQWRARESLFLWTGKWFMPISRQSLFQNTPYVRCSIINHFNKQTGVTICLLGAKPMLRTGGAKMNKRWGSGPGLGWGMWDTCLRSKI